MTDTFLKKKWERVFNTFFDINCNKSIDWNDFELLFQKIKELRGEDSTEFKIVQDAMNMVWKALYTSTKGKDIMADIPDDACISIEEWDKLWSHFDPKHMPIWQWDIEEWDKLWSHFDPKHMPIWQWEYVKYFFFLLDKSGDKYIDVNEYKDVMHIYGISEADAIKAFNTFAIDKTSGKKIEKVDYGNFVNLWIQYFTSKNKADPGNALFGPW